MFVCLLSGIVFDSSTPINTRPFSSAPLVPNIFLEGENIDEIKKYTILKKGLVFTRHRGRVIINTVATVRERC